MVRVAMVVSVMLFGFVADVSAVTRYIDLTLTSNCTSGNYSISARNCTGDDGNAYSTIAAGVAPTQAGDTLYLRGGTYPQDQRIDLMTPNITGTATGWITIAGYPGERPVIRWFDPSADNVTGYGPFKAWGNRGYFIVENIIFDGALNQQDTRWQIRGGNHHFILRNLEMKNFWGSPIIVKTTGSDITIQNCELHDQQDGGASRHYGLYLSEGTNVLVENNHIHHNPGGGFHIFQGPMNHVVVRHNSIHHNGTADWASGGMVVSANPDATGGVPALNDVQIYDNLIYKNGLLSPHANPSGLILAERVTGTKVYNNVIYGNKGYGILTQIGSGSFTGHPINATYQNNIVMANTIDQMLESGTGTTKTFNGCLSGDVCGSNKITFATTTEPFVDAASDDYRLKQGSNPARNSGTIVSSRPSPVGVTDLGAYEQGAIASAVVNDGIDLTVNVMSPGVRPSTGIAGVTITCVGCSGSPVATAVGVKAGSSKNVHVAVSGITTPGSCTISLGTTNMVDSLAIGLGLSQFVNSVSGMSVSGTCDNSAGGVTPPSGTAYYKLNEGSGTLAGDESAFNNDGIVSAGVTWTTVFNGTGLRFPNDTTFRHLEAPFGASTNMGTAAGATCATIKADPSLSQKVMFSSGSNGNGQRLYFGQTTVGGQAQWGIGIQDSGFSTGSEFPVTANLSTVCLSWGSGTATLWVNGVKGAQAGKSVKTYTSYVTTATNFRYGNDGTNAINNGGFDIDEIVLWDSLPSDATIQAYHTSRFPSGPAAACYSQAAHQAQRVHIVGGSAVDYLGVGATEIEVVENGAVAVVVQINCTGVAGTPISVVPYYAMTAGGAFNLPVPLVLGADGISLYGAAVDPDLNSGVVSGNLSGSLTNHAGVTILTDVASPEVLLAQDHSVVMRWIFKFGAIAGQRRWVKLKQDNGQDLAGGVVPADGIAFKIVPMRAGVQ